MKDTYHFCQLVLVRRARASSADGIRKAATLFIDEAHYFKNLETPTKMEHFAGIQTGGSERAFDVYMKAQYLHEQHPGHGVTFATGTPVCEEYRRGGGS